MATGRRCRLRAATQAGRATCAPVALPFTTVTRNLPNVRWCCRGCCETVLARCARCADCTLLRPTARSLRSLQGSRGVCAKGVRACLLRTPPPMLPQAEVYEASCHHAGERSRTSRTSRILRARTFANNREHSGTFANVPESEHRESFANVRERSEHSRTFGNVREHSRTSRRSGTFPFEILREHSRTGTFENIRDREPELPEHCHEERSDELRGTIPVCTLRMGCIFVGFGPSEGGVARQWKSESRAGVQRHQLQRREASHSKPPHHPPPTYAAALLALGLASCSPPLAWTLALASPVAPASFHTLIASV